MAATADASLGLGEWDELARLSPATAAEATVMPDLVRFNPDNEPVGRRRRRSARAMMGGQIRKRLPSHNALATLFMASLRLQLVASPCRCALRCETPMQFCIKTFRASDTSTEVTKAKYVACSGPPHRSSLG
jgi:hypothetical protein